MFLKHKSILVALGSLLCAGITCAFADDQPLKALPPTMDNRQVQSAPLQGSVNMTDQKGGSDDAGRPLNGTAASEDNRNTPLNGDVQDNGNPNLQMLTPQTGSRLFRPSARRYTAQEFRDMKYGVVGLVALRPLFGGRQTVIAVYPGCPAALAGIRPGDVEIQTGDHVMGKFENQRTTWNSTDGEAGTPVDITVRRGHQFLTFHMTRMNIEDIPDERVRHGFERLLEKLGPPNKQNLPEATEQP